MRRKRGYDDYLQQKPASPTAYVVIDQEPASAKQPLANLALYLAANTSEMFSIPHTGIWAHRLDNRGFDSVISRRQS